MSKDRGKKTRERAKQLKSLAVKKAHKAVQLKKKHAASLATFKSDPTLGYEFWLVHGANFLLSPYKEGVWSPVYPEIYAGKAVSRSDLYRRLLDRHLDAKTNRLSNTGTRALVWLAMKPDQMFKIVYRARALARKNGKDPHAPGQADVWDLLYTLIEDHFLAYLNANGNTVDGQFTLTDDVTEPG